jgi:DNA repair protein SbcD/Mre11
MRLLHTSDWHLGKVTSREPRYADHDVAFKSLLELARDFKPDLILHTGDLFDGSRPAYEDMRHGIEMLQELSSVARVAVLCGNHDSDALFGVFDQIVGAGGPIVFIDKVRKPDEGGLIRFPAADGSNILLGALPFVHANRFAKYFTGPETQMATYADRIKQIEALIGKALNDRRERGKDVTVFAAHLYVGEAVKSGTERKLHVTDEYLTPHEAIPACSYAAFGHIHKAQRLPGTRMGWYAGSLIPIDFGEVGEPKGAVIVEASPGHSAKVDFVELKCGRPLMVFKGSLDKLQERAADFAGSLAKIRIDTEVPTPQLRERVEAILGDSVTVADVEEDCAATRLQVLEPIASDGSEPGYGDLFRDYISETGTRGARVDLVTSAFDRLLNCAQTQQELQFRELQEEESRETASS